MNYEPRLYIIMRKDLWDMNPGKGMAQAAHAQALFDLDGKHDEYLELYYEWRGDGDFGLGFGVTTVLQASNEEIWDIVQKVEHSGRVHDPTYPFRNWYGEMFTTSVVTAAWAFPVNDEEFEFMKNFELHP
jgi:peptidyl-tRNA hydrolase